MTQSEPREPRTSSGEIVETALLASPAAAMWIAARGVRSTVWGWIAAVALTVVTVAAAALLFTHAVRWQIAAAAWGGYCLLGGAAVALWWRSRDDRRRGPDPPRGWARHALVAILAVSFVMPASIVFARVAGIASVGGLLVRLDPTATDPELLLGLIVLSPLWWVPAGIAFAIRSLRRGRLLTSADQLRAVLAWFLVLLLYEIAIGGTTGALRRLMLGAELADDWAETQEILMHAFGVVASIRVTSWVAWGTSRWPIRALGAILGWLAIVGNAGLILGMTPRVHFGLGRLSERSGQVEAALSSYGDSLRARSTPLIESYLQHRIGLLQYKLGNHERAKAAFRLVQTAHDANSELVRQSSYYLEHLDAELDGERVVLDGVEVVTEHRDSYCAPNTLALVFDRWGIDRSPGEIGEQVALIGGGTSGSDIAFACQRNRLEHELVPFAEIDDIRWLIDHGIPALVYIPGHVLAVFGYDTRLGTLVAYDTAQWDIWVDQPIPEFEEAWGERYFLLGLVLPRDSSAANVIAARERFSNELSRAAWHWWLAEETTDRYDKRAQLRAALTAAPTFFPAAFDLYSNSERSWIDKNLDGDGLIAEALRLLDRDRTDVWSLADELGYWLYHNQRHQQLEQLTSAMEARGQLDAVRDYAGLAAARAERWQRAAFLLSEVAGVDDPDSSLALAEAELALGRPERAGEVLTYIDSESATGTHLERAIRIAARIDPSPPPLFWERLLLRYLRTFPGDVERQLRLAETALAIVAEHPGDDIERRIHRARRAATYAAALAWNDAQRGRAEALLERIAQRKLE